MVNVLTMLSRMKTPSTKRHKKLEMIPKLRNTMAAISWTEKEKWIIDTNIHLD